MKQIKQKVKSTISKRIRVRASGVVERRRVHHQHHRGHLTNRQKVAGRLGTVTASPADIGLVK